MRALVVIVAIAASSPLLAQPTVREPVGFAHIKISDSFWAPRLKAHANATLPICIEQTEIKTGRIRNFEKAAAGQGTHEGIYYDDSDVYKVLEGMAYSLVNNPNPELEKKCDEWIDKIAAAQRPDGYLNTYYTLTGIDQRWTDMEKHEEYCAGHLIEAAVAYFHATGKRKLLDVAIKLADHMDREFGPGKKHWVVGHQEPELALVKLYRVTGNTRYVDLAYWMLEERGRGHGRGRIWTDPKFGAAYCQDDVPVRALSDITGHAVRAMYLYTGMADVNMFRPEANYLPALMRVWDDVVHRNMYITGGIGSSRSNEGFTVDYDLPNETAYCETCASIGMVFWNHRMFLLTGESQYMNVLERSLYNAALDGVSLSGDRFFYVNPLASEGNHHRKEWYGTACCPSNISRLLPSLGDYLYAVEGNRVWVNLYVTSEGRFTVQGEELLIEQQTNYPWSGDIQLTVRKVAPKPIELQMRIPEWNKQFRVTINGGNVKATRNRFGYVSILREWKPGDRVELKLDMPIEVVSADPRVKANEGKRAIQRGPLVYCLEEADNPGVDFSSVQFSARTVFEAIPNSSILNNVTLIRTKNLPSQITLIPYYAWDNRTAGKMKVWIDYR